MPASDIAARVAIHQLKEDWMDDGNEWEPVARAVLEELDDVIDRRLAAFRDSLEEWLSDILGGPISDDWPDRLAQLVERTAKQGVSIATASIDAIARIIESRRRASVQAEYLLPTNVDWQRRSQIARAAVFQPSNSNPGESQTSYVPSIYSEPRRSALNLSEEAFFHEKLAKAKNHSDEIRRLIEALGQKIDGIELNANVDIDTEVNLIEEQIFLLNDALESARGSWLRGDLPALAYNRLIAIPLPAALGLPLFADAEQAARANRQRYEILQRLHSDNAAMDQLVLDMQRMETAGTVAGVFAVGGLLITAAKTGGRWAVAKTLAVGAAAFAVEQGAETGLRAAGASEQTIRGARLAAAIVSFILLRRRSGVRASAPQPPAGSAAAANSITVAEEFGPGIGRTGYRTTQQFADAVFDHYQEFYDAADTMAQAQVAAGKWSNDPMVVGARVDAIARAAVRQWLESEGIFEGPRGIIEVNRWLPDLTGSSACRIPDIRIPGANVILEGTLGRKTSSTPQVIDFRRFSRGNNVIIVRPTRMGGSYGIAP